MLALGGCRAESLQDLGARSDAIVVMVLNFPQMQEVILGP